MPEDETRTGEPDTPSVETPHEAERSLAATLMADLNQVGVGLATMASAYGVKKAIDKFHEQPPDSGPKPNENQSDKPELR
jgi:hypothetical protein